MNSAAMTNTVEDFKNVIKLEFQGLTSTLGAKLDSGFKEVSEELKIMREQGNLPVSVVQSMISSNNDTYRSVIKMLCWAFGAIIAGLIATRVAFPNIFGS